MKLRADVLFWTVLILLYGMILLFVQNPICSWAVPFPSSTASYEAADMDNQVVEQDGLYCFGTPDLSLACWDGEMVRTLILPGNFWGRCLRLDGDWLYYSDTYRYSRYGLFAYNLSTGQTEKLVDYSDFPDFPSNQHDIIPSVFWWTSGDAYYFLSHKAGTSAYTIWRADAEGNFLDREILPTDLHNVYGRMGDNLICSTVLYMSRGQESNRDICLYNYKTGERKTLLEYDISYPGNTNGNSLVFYGQPIGYREGKLIVPYLRLAYYAVDLETSETELFAEVKDPLLRLVYVSDNVTYAVRSESGSADNARYLGIYEDGRFTEIGRMDGSISNGQAGDVYFLHGSSDTLFTDTQVIDLTGDPVDGRISEYAVLPDGTVYRLYAAP